MNTLRSRNMVVAGTLAIAAALLTMLYVSKSKSSAAAVAGAAAAPVSTGGGARGAARPEDATTPPPRGDADHIGHSPGDRPPGAEALLRRQERRLVADAAAARPADEQPADDRVGHECPEEW